MRLRWPLAWRTTVDRLAAAVTAAEAAQNAAAAEVSRARTELARARAHKTLTPHCRRCEPQHTPTGAIL